jgi:hypothetical protein
LPRELDLFRKLAQVQNNPLNTIGAGSLAKIIAQPTPNLAEVEAQLIDQAVNNFLTQVDNATGLNLLAWAQELESLFSGSTNLLTSLTTEITNAWNNWVATLDNLDKATVKDFTDFITAIDSNASNAYANWTTVLEDLGLSQQTATGLVSWLQTLLEPNSPLNASNLWGLIPTKSVGAVAATAVNSTTPNLLTNPDFQAAISLSPGGQWSWDSTVYYTPPSGDTAPGAAKVVANGTAQGLRSNPISVSGGQVLALSANILTSGLTYTGTPIELDVITFLGNTQVAVTPVVTSAAPTGATTSWVNPPSGSVAGTLSGNYTVPSSGVDGVKVRLALDSTATAGSVWFGAVSATLSGGLIASIQNDLSTLQSDSNASNAAFSTFLQSVLSDITGYTSWSTFITAVESAWNTYTTTVSGLASNEIFTIQQLINSLLGISPTTGQMSATNVQSSTGAANLQADINAVFTPFESVNGLTSTTAWQDSWNGLMGLLGIQTSNLSGNTPTTQVPSAAVTGIQSGTSLGAILQNGWDSLEAALGITTTVTAGTSTPASVAAAAATVAQNASTAAATSLANQNILGAVNNNPVSAGLEETVTSNFDYATASTTAGITPFTSSAGTCVRMTQAKTLGFVQWVGFYTAGHPPTGLYINFYKMDSSGNLDLLFTSANLVTALASTAQWNIYDFPTADLISVNAGDVIAVEFQVTGTAGTYTLAGLASSATNNHPTANIQNIGFTQSWSSAASTIPAASVGWTGKAPYVGLGVGAPSIPPLYQQPIQSYYGSAGTQTYTLPPWFRLGTDYLDAIVLGGGGGGGAGAAGGGSAGGGTTITVTTASGSQTLTGAAGAGGASGDVAEGSTAYYGGSPGNYNWNSINAYGGGTANWGTAGSPAGGGGGGAQYFDFYGYGGHPGSFNAATYQPTSATVSVTVGAGGAPNAQYSPGAGAAGGVWLLARQA